VRDRIILGLSIVVLFGGLAVWAFTGRGVDDDQDRRQYIQSLREPPPLGIELHPADPRGTAVADAFRRAGLGEAPLRILFERDHHAVVGASVASRDAMRVWEALHDVQSQTHLAPVILGDGFSLARHADAATHTSASVEAVLARASTLDLDAWLAARPAPDPGTPVPVAKGWLRVSWSKPTGAALEAVEAKLKALKLTIRNAPLDQPSSFGACVFTGAAGTEEILIARAY